MATDWDFGAVIVGDTLCHSVRVANSGKAPFMLTREWVINNYASAAFSFPDASKLPYLLESGKYIDLNFCYAPTTDSYTDSSVVTWGTDISESYKTVKKNFTVLRGFGIKPSLEWEPEDVVVHAPCDSTARARVYLSNYGSAYILIDSLVIKGPSHSQWKIADVQGGRTKNIILGQDHLPDSMWVDLQFTPDAAYNCKGLDTLIAYDDRIRPFAVLAGNVSLGVPTDSVTQTDVVLTPNPVENELRVRMSAGPVSSAVEVLDILGNVLIAERSRSGKELLLDVRGLAAGVYFLRLEVTGTAVTKRFVKR
jgi:hypothetical protein